MYNRRITFNVFFLKPHHIINVAIIDKQSSINQNCGTLRRFNWFMRNLCDFFAIISNFSQLWMVV